MRNRLVQMLARHWAAFRNRRDTAHRPIAKTDGTHESIRRAEQGLPLFARQIDAAALQILLRAQKRYLAADLFRGLAL